MTKRTHERKCSAPRGPAPDGKRPAPVKETGLSQGQSQGRNAARQREKRTLTETAWIGAWALSMACWPRSWSLYQLLMRMCLARWRSSSLPCRARWTMRTAPTWKRWYGRARPVGRALKKNDIVLYESTFYTATAEKVCVPMLERVYHWSSTWTFSAASVPSGSTPATRYAGWKPSRR